LTARLSPLKHKTNQHHWQCEGQDRQRQDKDSGQGGERTLVKTHTGKMSSLRPVGCVSDQLPTRGTPTRSLCLAREVSASRDKSLPRTRSFRLAREVRPRLARGPRRTSWAPPPTRVEEQFSMPCKYNSWRPCKQLTTIRALMLIWPATRPSHRHHLPLCHTQARPEALKHPLWRACA
jgi:hypothetical protein